jgi:type IV secretion system protein VirB10
MLTINEKDKISILGDDEEEEKPANSDPNSAFEASVIENSTEAEKVEATRIANLQRTIAQGRIIHATLESALNTDLPAPVRAIVSRDTYAEAGHEVLIPKGSRLIGVYNTDISGGQSRVFLVWTRVIRPDGVDVMLGSPLVDQIGQAGIGGQVDSKFQSIFSRALLSSIVAISLAIGSDEVNRKMGGESSTTTTDSSLGGSQTSGNAASTATVDALDRLGETSDSFLDKFLELRPTILVDQGTPVNVFVNRDLIFPARAGHSTQVVN